MERTPDAQVNTTSRPCGSGRSIGSSFDSGTNHAPGDAFMCGFVGLASIDRNVLVGEESFGTLFGRQIPDRASTEQSVHQMPLTDDCSKRARYFVLQLRGLRAGSTRRNALDFLPM